MRGLGLRRSDKSSLDKPWLTGMVPSEAVSHRFHFFVMCVFLMLIVCRLKMFGLCFTVDGGEGVSHFLFLHQFSGPHYRVMCICKYEKISSMSVCVSVVLWCNE